MLRGHLDVLVSAGFFEGWAYDTQSPTEPLLVAVLDGEDAEVACGLAHRYRPDLVAAKCGIGWCAFRLRTSRSVSVLRKSSFQLVERSSRNVIFRLNAINYVEGSERVLGSVADVIKFDPTAAESVDQLSGCQAIFDQFIKLRGVDAFVRTAYVYVLGRSADVEGQALYGKLIRQGLVSPFTMIQTLANSTEFRSKPRSLIAPNTAGFPFERD